VREHKAAWPSRRARREITSPSVNNKQAAGRLRPADGALRWRGVLPLSGQADKDGFHRLSAQGCGNKPQRPGRSSENPAHACRHGRRRNQHCFFVPAFGAHLGAGLPPRPVGETGKPLHEPARHCSDVEEIYRRSQHQPIAPFPFVQDVSQCVGMNASSWFGARGLHALATVDAKFDVRVHKVYLLGRSARSRCARQRFRHQAVYGPVFSVASDNSQYFHRISPVCKA